MCWLINAYNAEDAEDADNTDDADDAGDAVGAGFVHAVDTAVTTDAASTTGNCNLKYNLWLAR